ncbi:uncharacterized protein LOC132195333 [Neocloeon triangulifer]|uniref:uncharacterized protein LOC132195333 n=1 Tax=Neocloeon triangulifer TaxID=2078957 RepID=UPI00286FA39F|nr:uncharacterized protein LOC132195333 [Neocloeon triangulifer]
MGRAFKTNCKVTPAAILFLLSAMIIGLEADSDAGTFFLKATKNVPRIGRRSGGGDTPFFLKATKNVPRIGRRGEGPNSWGISEAKDGSTQWSSGRQDVIPNRVARTGPTSLTTLWNSPVRSQVPNSRTQSALGSEAVRGPDSSEENTLMGPRYELFDSSSQDLSSQEIEFSAAQMVAPPPFQTYQRLPQEGGYSPFRPRREDQNKEYEK